MVYFRILPSALLVLTGLH